jgi:hypothetical protein
MKKENIRIFAMSFVMICVLIAGLCVLYKQPLVFAEGYQFPQFFTLFLLLGTLSFGLVFVMETLERIFKRFLTPTFTSAPATYIYFTLVSAFGLFVFTLLAGFSESGLPFFYYGCVTNSCIYLFSAYAVTFVVAVYFAYRLIKASSTKSV